MRKNMPYTRSWLPDNSQLMQPASTVSRSVRASLFLISAATLAFEINLSRLFSITQFYHFAFMIVSLALLGFGASGTFLAIWPRLGRQHPASSLAALALGTAASIIGAYWLTNNLPFDSYSIAWDLRQAGILALHYTVLALPFFFSGTAVGLLLSLYPGSAGAVYATNLTGSAMGCLAALAAPSFLGGEGTIVLSSSLAALAGLISHSQQTLASQEVHDPPEKPGPPSQTEQSNTDLVPEKMPGSIASFTRSKGSLARLLAGVMLAINLYAIGWQAVHHSHLPALALNLSPYKSLSYALQVPDAEIVSQRWNAFSRVDLVSSPGIRSLPGISFRYSHAPPPELGLFVDGDNLNPVVLPGSDLDFSASLPTALVYELRPNARVLILEPGGGLDLLTALNQGAVQVTAAQPNPLVAEAAIHIYNQPKVETVYETGRSYLRRSSASFNLVLFSLTDSYHPVRSGAFSLTEDYRYTLEAFQDALHQLNEDGILVVTRWLQIPPSEWLRAFILAVTALEEQGLSPIEQIAAIRSFNIGLLLVKQKPYTADELITIRRFSEQRAFDLVYLPDLQPEETNRFNILPESLYYQAFTGFLNAGDRQAWLNEYPYEVSPPTDDHPFYGHYFKWSQTPQILAELGKSWQPFGGAGYFVLLVLLALSIGMAGVMILLPLTISRRMPALPEKAAGSLTYFGLLGLAFMLIEIPLVQRLILYLGQPSYAFSTALFSILLFSGLGSQKAARFSQRWSLAGLILVVLVTPWVLERLFDWTLGFPLVSRLILAGAVLAPVGFLMGIPFPRGIHMLETTSPHLIPWAWGVNGALSVIASILAALVTLTFGFRWALLLGAACYAGAWLVTLNLKERAQILPLSE